MSSADKNGNAVWCRSLRTCWRSCRHCMCTAGWYPALVAPVVSAGFILSLYSSAGCKFINIDIGFLPSNIAWNQSEADVGLFFYYDGLQAANEQNDFKAIVHEGCSWYTESFEETFIEKDRTWKVARVMSLIAIAGSLLASLTCWLIVLLPLPVNCIWTAIVLPTAMLAFIAEGSKFLLFDIALCRNPVWYSSDTDSLPVEAQSCTLGESAYIGIAAGVVHLGGLLSVCLKAPEKRRLDPNFARISVAKDPEPNMDSEKGVDSSNKRSDNEEEEDASVLDDDIYTPGPSPANVLHISHEDNSCGNFIDPSLGESSSIGSNDHHSMTIKPPTYIGNISDETISSNAVQDSKIPRISESRLTVMSKMQLVESSESTDMIAKLVSDLDSSLQDPVLSPR